MVRETASSLRTLRATKYGMAPLGALLFIDYMQSFDNKIFLLIGPELRIEFNQSITSLVIVSQLMTILLLVLMPLIGYVNDRVRRTWLVGISAMLSGLFSLLL